MRFSPERAAAWKLSDGNEGEPMDIAEALAKLQEFEQMCEEKLAEEEQAALAALEKKKAAAEKAASKKKK